MEPKSVQNGILDPKWSENGGLKSQDLQKYQKHTKMPSKIIKNLSIFVEI